MASIDLDKARAQIAAAGLDALLIALPENLAYATGFLIWQPVTWLPQEWIARALVFQHLAKIVVAGLLFFYFLRHLRVSILAASLGSFLLSF